MQTELLRDVSSLIEGYKELRQTATIQDCMLQLMKIYLRAIAYADEVKRYADGKDDKELKNYLGSIECDELVADDFFDIVNLCDFLNVVDHTCNNFSKYIEEKGIKVMQ